MLLPHVRRDFRVRAATARILNLCARDQRTSRLGEPDVVRVRRGRGGLPRMKLARAIVKPFKLDEVRDALTSLRIEGQAVRIRTGEQGADAL